MNIEILKDKCDILKTYENFRNCGKEIDALASILATIEESRLFHLNPLEFAQEYSLNPSLLMDIFIYGSKIGLFNIKWNVLCPACGGVEYSHNALSQLTDANFHCTICNIAISSDWETQIEVAFSIHPSIVSDNRDPFSSFAAFKDYFFSKNYIRSARLTAYSKEHFIFFCPLEVGEELIKEIKVEPGTTYRLLSVVAHSSLQISAGADLVEGCTDVEIYVTQQGFSRKCITVETKTISLRIKNVAKSKNAVTFMKADFELLNQILKESPNQRLPFLSAKMMLSNQSFRDLYQTENLARGFKLNINSLTVLFIDLEGSTKMYEDLGDLVAYQWIQNYFSVMRKIIHAHEGAIIKTMGDAIMATFSTPIQGFLSAQEMHAQSTSRKIKIGMHAGEVLAVNANEIIDFFGQTVNIAARLQHLAPAGFTYFSSAIKEDVYVRRIIKERAITCSSDDTLLKGLNEPIRVHGVCLSSHNDVPKIMRS